MAENIEEIKKELKMRTDEVGALTSKVSALEAEIASLKEQAGVKDIEAPGKVNIKVLNPKTNKEIGKTATLIIPKVRVDGEIVSSVAFMKIALGKKLSEEELKANGILKDMEPSEAVGILTKWANKKVGFVELS